MLQALRVFHYDNKVRNGCNADGGYVYGVISEKYDCYISCGVANEESFSCDFINTHNMRKTNSFAFDGTIQDYPVGFTDNITFIKKNINVHNDDNNTNLSFLTQQYSNIFLKMDIEGGEYPWLLSRNESDIKKFKQIVIEVHGLYDDNWGATLDNKIKVLQKLAQTHYIIHAHGNNHVGIQNNIPEVLELTYLNKDCFTATPEINKTPFPISNLDYPCLCNKSDYILNTFPFCQI